MKMASSSGMSETAHHNGSHLLLLGKRKLQSFQKPHFFNSSSPIGATSLKINKRPGCLKKEKSTPTSFFRVTSRNLRIIPQNFLTFSFNYFATLV